MEEVFQQEAIEGALEIILWLKLWESAPRCQPAVANPFPQIAAQTPKLTAVAAALRKLHQVIPSPPATEHAQKATCSATQGESHLHVCVSAQFWFHPARCSDADYATTCHPQKRHMYRHPYWPYLDVMLAL